MNKQLITIALLALTFNAYATERQNDTNLQSFTSSYANSTSTAGANALSSTVSGATGGYSSNGDMSVSLDNEKPAVSSAIAPSLTQNVICPIITPNSHAVQFLVFGGSTTGTQSLNAICVAYHLKQYEILEQMTCAKSAEYRKANVNCK